MAQIKALLFNDPSCPFGYSANPALRVLEWRYRDQIEWHLAVIGLSDPENPSPFEPRQLAGFQFEFRDRHGMPFSIEPKSRPMTTSRACRVIVAARLLFPGSEWRVLRTLQLLNFNTPLLLDDDSQLAAALETVPGIDPAAVMSSLDSNEVEDAYRADWTQARSAAGGPGELQGKTSESPGGVRYTAPSVIFESEDQRIEAAGFQTIEAYDLAVANLDPTLIRTGPADDPLEVLGLYPAGLTTRELAAVMTPDLKPIDHTGAEQHLVELLGEDKVKRVPLGSDALWLRA